ncbi:JAB domain-containing protein [Pantoea sp. App145]|uniref:JAB domain-containing protein n=1 Tax=Pantoea sp. App145 TaxID=3071567 RepID=UPI003A7FA576
MNFDPPGGRAFSWTLRIKNILELVDVRLLDHIIIGGNDVVSMAREGLIGM